jgi:uncharacterized protein (TIGR03067 family)
MDSTEVCPSAKQLKALLDRELPESEQAALNTHLEDCLRCQQTLEGLVAGKESWADLARHLQGAAGAETTRTAVPGGAGGTSSAGQPEMPAPERLGHFEVREVVGRGGMGIVYKAFDPKLHRVVALKVMAAELATSAAARQRFDREVKAAAGVAHEHVVTIHGVDQFDGLPAIVMQYVAGVSLQERIERSGPLQLKEILRIGMQTARGLAAAHAQGMVHRDVKPANILLENGIERVRITDFGLARAVDDASLTQSGVIAGTPMYMAPEQAAGQPIDHRADLFSLGSVLYAMCTGRPPFRASGTMAVLKRVCEETPRPIREINPDIPDWLCAIVEKLHAKKPEERFQSAKEVADLLEAHLAHLQQPSKVPLPAPVERPTPTPPARKRRLRRWAARLGIVALVGWAVFWFGPAALRYLGNRGEVSFSADGPGLVRIMVIRDGQMVTDFDPRTNPTIELPPGNYMLKPTQTPGRAVNYWELTAFDMFTGHIYMRPGISCEFDLKRGQRVSVRALMHDSFVPPHSASDKELLQGTWVAVSGEIQGERLRAEDVRGGRLVFKGGNARITMPGGEQGEGTFKLDPAVDPKEIDVIRAGDSGGMLGIYRLDGDRLTICMGDPGEPRPKRFETTPDSKFNHMLLVLQRASEAEQGWVSLFNGKNLAGWKLHPDQPGDWKVENGVLVGSGRPSFLFSERGDYENFHLRAEVKINEGGNSGVFFRAGYELTRKPAWGTNTPHGYEAEIFHGGGGAQTGSLIGFQPFAGALSKPNEWFTLEIIAEGDHLRLKVNGTTTADFVDQARTYTKGHIALQMHFLNLTVVQFRKIEIKELPKTDVGGWVQLFNGKNLGGWKRDPDQPGDWRVENGVLIGRGPAANELVSARPDFENFHLRLEAKINALGNSGLIFRRAPAGERPGKGYESDIDPSWMGALTKRLGTGTPVPLGKPVPGGVSPDKWFSMEVIADGDSLTTIVDGKTVAKVRDDGPDSFRRGSVALQVYNPETVVEFRKIEVKELPKTDAGGFVSLFNGKDLAGWKTHEDQPGDWKVDNGVLVGYGRKSHLFSERGDFENFHLRFQAKYNAAGDTGVVIRTPYVIKPGWGGPLGYEAQITKTRTGTVLVGEDVFGDPAVVEPDTWFTGEVIATDNRIVVRVNGVTTANFEDPRRAYMKGHLALQVWNPETVVHFRKIEIKELPPVAPAPREKRGGGD